MSSFLDALTRGVLVCDGAMGTMLHSAGNSLDRALPELNLSNPHLVKTIHESYVGAGVHVIQTNTFGASRLRLAGHGYGDLVHEINLAGASIAGEVARAAGRDVFVAGSVSPSVTVSQRRRTTPAARVEALHEQVEALAAGGVDLLVLETFGYLDELVEAATIATQHSQLPVVAQATFAGDGRTLAGETPREVVAALRDLPVAVLGTNCTLGPQGVLGIVEALRAATGLPISAQPNAGLPRRIAGPRYEYSVDGAYFARYARLFVEAGAALVGGCCGTTPAHISAAADEVAGTPAAVHDQSAASTQPPPARPSVSPAGPAAAGETMAERLAARRFVVAAETPPPLGGSVDEAREHAAALRHRGVDLFFVTPRDSARAHVTPVNFALHLQQHGVEAIATVTTWDKTIMALQADLLGAHALGVRSVVCETGDPPLLADYPNVDGVWEVDSLGLIELLSELNQGRDCNGLSLATKTSFHIGARVNAGAEDQAAEITRAMAKVQAGAQFLVTRRIYELDGLRSLITAMEERPEGARAPILANVAPLRSFLEADYLAHEVPDLHVPDASLRAMEGAGGNGARVGLELALDLLRAVRPLVDGVVLSTTSDEPAVFDQLLAAT
ncbi:MAG: bifunctional homocysteine S-methyltransferase/methylenetetrahydrofolate reductase [Carbonactinosporaceae bacterium]